MTGPTPLHPVSPQRVVHPASEFPADVVRAAKGSRTVSVCLPARNEAATVGPIVTSIRDRLVATGLVDEVVVMDHGSVDGTAAVAAAAGARVIGADATMASFGPALGKGDVLWRSLAACDSDIVVWLDADLTSFHPGYVAGLLGPMLLDARIALVRSVYDRVLGGRSGEGGRVTELTARPALSLLFPDLRHVQQPLGGEYAVRHDVASVLPFEPDYGVEMGLLIDVAGRCGVEAVAQVDLGTRDHRHRPLAELRVQAEQVLRAALNRAPGASRLPGSPPLRPPMVEVRASAGELAG